MVPIRGSQASRGLATFLIETSDPATLAVCRERIELTIGLLSLYEMRRTLQDRQVDMSRLRLAMETLSALNEHDRFAGAGMAFCNELAARLKCERVGLGFLKGRYVHLKALSHTEKFTRKMKEVQEIEASMEECLDQDVEVVYPASADATYVCRATKELAARHGPAAVLTLPMRRAGKVVGTALLERSVETPFSLQEVEALRLTCDLATARLTNLHETDRWVGARMAATIRKGAALAVGPKHTWIKLLVIGLFGLAMVAAFVNTDYDAKGEFQFESTVQQALVAPYDGKLEIANVKPDDTVEANKTVLAQMDVTELLTERAAAEEKKAAADKDAQIALARESGQRVGNESPGANSKEGARADYQAAVIRGQEEQAHIDLLNKRIHDAVIRSPISGKVISDRDWTRESHPMLKVGDVLFEVAPLAKILRHDRNSGRPDR